MTRSRVARAALGGSLALWGVLFTVSARAGLVNDVPSCYVAERMPYKPAPPSHLIYVLLDETVRLVPDLQASVLRNLDGVIGPGTKFVIAEFSAYSEGRYLSVVHTGIVEPPLTAREQGNVPLARLPAFQTCLREQQGYAVHMANQTVQAIFQGSTATLGHSDILAALDTISDAIRLEPEQVRVLLLVSDGLENSSITSFYAHRTARRIDPHAEMAKAKAAGVVGDFGGAMVYVLGGAMMPPATAGTRQEREGYRDAQTLGSLKEFWSEYLAASHANLVEFGEPALLEPVSYSGSGVASQAH
jgi:hypothetical protein